MNYKNIAVYPYSHTEAKRSGALSLWQKSHDANIACRQAVISAVKEQYDHEKSHFNTEAAASQLVDTFGYDRLHLVLANSIKQSEGGRISAENKEWAKKLWMPQEKEYARQYAIDDRVNPGLVDMLTSQVRKMYAGLGLYDRSHCDLDILQEYENKVLVLMAEVLKEESKTPENQLFLAEGGFGCNDNSQGRKVFGKFLSDGEKTHFYREDFAGILREDLLPDWAVNKIAQTESSDEVQEPGISMT